MTKKQANYKMSMELHAEISQAASEAVMCQDAFLEMLFKQWENRKKNKRIEFEEGGYL